MLFQRTLVRQASSGVKVMAVLAVATVVGASAGCGGDSEATTTTSSSTTSGAAPTTTSTLTPEAEVEQAYLDFDQMLTRLRENPNPEDPEITKRTVGQARDGIINSQTTAKTFGEYAEFGPRDTVAVLDVVLTDNDTAVVHSCAVEQITIRNTGGRQIGPRLRTYWTDYTFTRAGSRWLVSSSAAIKKVDGEQPCGA